jgi:hypothetical protein
VLDKIIHQELNEAAHVLEREALDILRLAYVLLIPDLSLNKQLTAQTI